MKTKYKINVKGLESFRFGEDKNLWRLPYERNKRSYGARKMKMQYPNRWILNGVVWSKNQLKPHLIIDDNPIEIYKEDLDTPF